MDRNRHGTVWVPNNANCLQGHPAIASLAASHLPSTSARPDSAGRLNVEKAPCPTAQISPLYPSNCFGLASSLLKPFRAHGQRKSKSWAVCNAYHVPAAELVCFRLRRRPGEIVSSNPSHAGSPCCRLDSHILMLLDIWRALKEQFTSMHF